MSEMLINSFGGKPTIYTLTPEQKAIVTAPTGARILVIAGPGTGKTHVLITRLIHLVEFEGVSPGQEILILSFTRSAINEIRKRLATVEGAGRYVSAYTFDSFATRLLRLFSLDDAWSQLDYDGRIQAAAKLIRNHQDVIEYLRNFQHIFIDEIQDLVTIRVYFIKLILACISGGFTLLGDRAQSIYNYTLTGKELHTDVNDLLNWLRCRFANDLQEYKLTQSHRANSQLTKGALWLGRYLYDDPPDYKRSRQDLMWLYNKLASLGDIKEAYQFLYSRSKTTAILCRSNGRALLTSRFLHEMGIAHTYQQSVTERLIPTWCAVTLGSYPNPRIGRSAFLARVSELLPKADPTQLWEHAKRIEGEIGTSLDISRLAYRVKLGDVPDEVLQSSQSNLVVSTIHRAKGREFDRVILVDAPEEDSADPNIFVEETRILYVALTRARTEMYRVELPNIRGYLYKHTITERWVRSYNEYSFGNIEIKGNDVHYMDPAGAWLLLNCNPVETQRYLQYSVVIGDPVLLKRQVFTEHGAPRVHYEISHKGRPIGITSELFSSALYNILKISPTWKVKWPLLIDELFVEAVDTVVGTPAAGQRAGLGSNGLWLRVRIYGLGHLHFAISESS